MRSAHILYTETQPHIAGGQRCERSTAGVCMFKESFIRREWRGGHRVGVINQQGPGRKTGLLLYDVQKKTTAMLESHGACNGRCRFFFFLFSLCKEKGGADRWDVEWVYWCYWYMLRCSHDTQGMGVLTHSCLQHVSTHVWGGDKEQTQRDTHTNTHTHAHKYTRIYIYKYTQIQWW